MPGGNIKHLYGPPPQLPVKPLTEEDLQKPAPTQKQLRELLRLVTSQVLSPEHLSRVLSRVTQEAMAGNMLAVKMVIELLRGMPAEQSDESDSLTVKQRMTKEQVEAELEKHGFKREEKKVV